jgi:hypothetical protein
MKTVSASWRPRRVSVGRGALVLVAIGSLVAVGGCTHTPTGIVDLDVRLDVCADSGQQCFGLPLPEAQVAVSRSLGEKPFVTTKTDQYGKATFRMDPAGPFDISVISPLIDGGHKETSGIVSEGGDASVSLMVYMSRSAVSPLATPAG